VAIDIGTSPALVSNGGSFTSLSTASFTRPAAGSLLVVKVMALSSTVPTVSGGSLTWTRRIKEAGSYVEIWTAEVTGSGSMTVTLGNLSDGTGFGICAGMKVSAVTGHAVTGYIGQTGSGVSTSNTLNAAGYTSSANNSRGFFAALESNGLGVPTSTDTGFGWTASTPFFSTSGIAVLKAANTPTSGTPVSFNADAPGATAADWSWAALEIKPGGVGAEIVVDTIAVASTMPAPTVQVSASPTPGSIAVATSMPTPAVSAGVHAHPSTIAVAVAMPAPSVTTEDAELVELDTITVSVALPAPAVSIAAAPTMATIAVAATMYAPTIQVSANVTLATIAAAVEMPAPSTTVPVLPGDQISRAGQIEWNGFLLGSGTPYSWQELQGWVDSAPWISGNVERPDSSGSYPGRPYLAERAISWSTLIKAARDSIGQTVHDLVMATGPAQSEDEGWLVIWDWDDLQPWLVRAHLSQRQPGPINVQARLGLMRGALQWIASDPRRYDPVRSSLTIPKDTPTSILNNGNDSTPGELRFPGPCTAPQVENVNTDRVIAFSTTVADGETLVVDVAQGTAAIGDTNHLNDLVEGSSSVQDFVFNPGANELLYTTDSGGTAGMETFWRHAVS
jgi:hypothetical protein